MDVGPRLHPDARAEQEGRVDEMETAIIILVCVVAAAAAGLGAIGYSMRQSALQLAESERKTRKTMLALVTAMEAQAQVFSGALDRHAVKDVGPGLELVNKNLHELQAESVAYREAVSKHHEGTVRIAQSQVVAIAALEKAVGEFRELLFANDKTGMQPYDGHKADQAYRELQANRARAEEGQAPDIYSTMGDITA